MPEAPVRMSKNGLVVDGEGWFVMNARESRWKDEGPLGSYCTFEGKRRFPHFGFNISVLEPGEKMGMYHREKGQEAFLVLAGECTLIVEGQERRLAAWDFFYCLRGRSTSSSRPMHSQRSWWRLALAVEAEWFIRSVRPPPGTELASRGKQHSPLSRMQRCTRASRGRGLSSTGRVGFARRSEVVAWAQRRSGMLHELRRLVGSMVSCPRVRDPLLGAICR
jgi:quercetin dioxygenase-like cupin family protein